MKTNKILHCFLIGCSFFAATALSAQTIVTTWEAENFIGTGYRPVTNNYPIATSAIHSGGKYLQKIDQLQSVFYYVNVQTAGVYDLKIHYMAAAIAGQVGNTVGVRVNNQAIRGVQINNYTAADNSIPIITALPVYLDAGINLIRIGQNDAYISGSGYCPNIDYFELYTSTTTLIKPADDAAASAGLQTYDMQYTDYTDFPNWCTVSSASGNTTIGNLTDNSSITMFVSDNASETINLTFPDGFVLRRLVVDNPYVLVGLIERSLDGTTWSTWSGTNLFTSNNVSGVATQITGGAMNGTSPDYSADNTGGYKYYRVTFTKPYWASQLQIGEMQVQGIQRSTTAFNVADLTNAVNGTVSTNATIIDGSNIVGQAIDDSWAKKFSVGQSTFQVVYAFNNYARVVTYCVANAVNIDRDPKTWALQGSNDGTNYTTLHTVQNFTFPTAQCQYMFNIVNPNIYKYYRFDMQQNNGSLTFSHICELQLFGTLETNLATGVIESASQLFSAYGSDNQIILNNHGAKSVSYQIFDSTAKLVKQGKFTSSQMNISIGKGLYLVKAINNDAKLAIIKVIVK